MEALEWLTAGDPAIRWQALRDLADAPATGRRDGTGPGRDRGLGRGSCWRGRRPRAIGAAIRRREQWTSSPEWTCLVALAWLRDMGLDPASPEARHAVGLVRDSAWRGIG